MKIVYFVHAIASCWNNGNAHFLRGIGRELQNCGHEVLFCEPANGWSEMNLVADSGAAALDGFKLAYPDLRRIKYDAGHPDLDELTHGTDLVIVHEWNDASVVNGLSELRRRGAPFVLLFHDTHHRALSQPDAMQRFELENYDGILAFGAVLAGIYAKLGWGNRVWAWHEAADTTLFYPRPPKHSEADIVWIGNWGDEERTTELEEFLLGPAQALGLTATLFGVRYPQHAVASLSSRGFRYNGWLANHLVPEAFASHSITVHVPRRPYAEQLRGIPTIRVFEALACGIPLVSAPWADSEDLFPEGCFLMASNSTEMKAHLRALLNDRAMAQSISKKGLSVIRERHSCRHRVMELLNIFDVVKGECSVPNRQSEAA
jgi:spore maturation protein CgeB